MKLSPSILFTVAVLITTALASAYFFRESGDREKIESTRDSESVPTHPRGQILNSSGSQPATDTPRTALSADNAPVTDASAIPVPGLDRHAAQRQEVVAPGRMPSREELERRVERIQRGSEKRLAKLTRDLGLSEAQQHKVFAILARSSPAYHPSMKIGVPVGKGAGSADANFRLLEPDAASGGEKEAGVEDQIFEVLDQEQTELLAEQILDRDRWWADIVGLLEADLNRSLEPTQVPPVTDAGRDSAPQSDTSEVPSDANQNRGRSLPQNHGGRNLFDTVGGQ